MIMHKFIANLSIISVLFLLLACSSPTESANTEVDIIGTITDINASSERLEILVEEDSTVTSPERKNGKKIFFFISKKTKIYKQVNSKLTRLKGEHLKVGMTVKGWAGNLFLESYPPRTNAVQIIVIGK